MSEVKDETPAAPVEAPAAEEVKPVESNTPVDEDSMSSHDLSIPKIEGKSEEEVKELLEKAAKQVNFYFSDSNLPNDKFFFSLTACNEQGWVPIKTIGTFKRMREFSDLGMDFVVRALRRRIAEELKDNDAFLWMDKAGQYVRRKRPLERGSNGFDRSAYVKGFGEEEDSKTQEKVEKYFDQFGAKINQVRLRRKDDPKGAEGNKRGAFKGSVFVEFAYKADLEKFIARESYPKYQTGDSAEDMQVMTKEQYVEVKAKEHGVDPKEWKNNSKQASSKKDKKGSDKNAPGKKWNAFNEMEKLKHGKLPNMANIPEGVDIVGKPIASASSQFENKKKRSRDDDEDEGKAAKQAKPNHYTIKFLEQDVNVDPTTGRPIDANSFTFVNDVVLKWSNDVDSGDWKALKTSAHEILGGEIAPFVGRPPQLSYGYLSKQDNKTAFNDEEIAKLNDAKIDYGGKPVTFERLDENGQREYWVTRATFLGNKAIKEATEGQSNGRDKKSGGKGYPQRNGGGGRGGGRGGRGRGGKRGGRGGHGGRGRDEKPAGNNMGLPPTVATN